MNFFRNRADKCTDEIGNISEFKTHLSTVKKSHFQIRSNFSFRPANKDEIIVLIMKDLKIITPLVEKFLSTFKNLN